MWHQCLVLALFVACSCVMMPLNKLVMHQLRHTPLTAVAGQMIGATFVLLFTPWRTGPELYRCLILPPLFATMLVTSMLSLQHASLGAIVAIRNTAPLICLPLEHYFVAPQHVSVRSVASLACMLFGCIGYVWHDLHTTHVGLVLATINMLAGVCDRLVQRHILSTEEVNKCSLLLINNLAGGLIVAALAAAAKENAVAALCKESARLLWLLSVAAGLLMGYSGALAQAHVSATTHLLVSNMNRVVVLLVGSTLFGETVQWAQWVAVAALLVGSISYAL